MNDRQSEDEVAIFSKFARSLPYFTQIDSIQKGQEPEPDIVCKLSDGTTVYFELVECVDNSVAKFFYGGSLNGGFFSDDLCLGSIAKKVKKKYSHSCDLLVYFDLQPVVTEKSWLPYVEDFVKENIKQSPFKRIWIYSVPQEKIMSIYPRSGDAPLPSPRGNSTVP